MTTINNLAEVQNLLRLESEAIARTATRMDQVQVEKVIDLLVACSGKVVIMGVGKSGIIAQKIAATMTSAGTAALYLHPSDALHGGLGIVQSNEGVMGLSNSGETAEIVDIVPYLKHLQGALIAIVRKLDSTVSHRT